MDKPQIESMPVHLELPLALYSSERIGVMRMPDWSSLSIQFGLSREMVETLKAHALDLTDEELQNNTSDRRRFGEGSYEDWFKKERYPFALVSEANELAAIIWFGPEAFPGGEEPVSWDTVAFRSYIPYRGKGVMTPFGRFALATYLKLMPGHTVWLETDATNVPAVRLYEKLGFRSRGYREGAEERLLMVHEEEA